MDLHRIPDDLSIPEFLKRELDDVESRVLIRTWEKAIEKDERKKGKARCRPQHQRRRPGRACRRPPKPTTCAVAPSSRRSARQTT